MHEFRPSKWLYFWRWMLIYGAAILAGALCVYMLTGRFAWEYYLGLGVGLAFWSFVQVHSNSAQWTISVHDTFVSGPSRSGGKRIDIPLQRIDRLKTAMTSRWDWIRGRYIYGDNGAKISLRGDLFSGEQIRAILKSIGVD